MQDFEIILDEKEFNRLNSLYPQTGKSSDVGKRAEELILYYFRQLHPECQFSYPKDGADLLVTWTGGSEKIEIKGTADSNIAWSKLKVSGKDSHDLLERGLPMYRVTSIYERNPRIFILIHGEDFLMEPEPRWLVRKT